MTHLRNILLAALPVLAALDSAAQAGPIYNLNVDAKGGIGHLETVTWTFNGVQETGLAGTLTAKGPDGAAFDAYCIDIYSTTPVGNGGSNYAVEALPIGSFTGNATGRPAGGNGGAIAYLYSRYAASAGSAIEGAALQLAIWKVEYDNSASLSTGYFRLADARDAGSVQHQVFAQTAAYLAGFDGTQSSGDATLYRATSHPNGLYQDLVGPGSPGGTPTPNLAAVPEPATFAMLACGLVTVGLASVRRRARNP